MADIQELSAEIDRVLTAPYEASLQVRLPIGLKGFLWLRLQPLD